MYKYSTKFMTYDDVEVEGDFYFNLSKAELMRMEMSQYGGMEALLKKIVKEQDTKRIYNMFEEIVQTAYGEKSDDGRRFIKNQEILDNFTQTEAYSELIMKMLNEPDFANEFIRGIFPKDVAAEMDKQENALPKKVNNPLPAPPEK